jgi:putative ABC transport system permease protein
MSRIVGALVEAWDELRVHRGRVLLSLIGVAVAVCALTSVVGFGAIAQQAQVESLESGSGRPATIIISTPYDPTTGTQASVADFTEAADQVVERYRVTYSGMVTWLPLSVQFVDGVAAIDSAQAVDVDYGTMHRVRSSSTKTSGIDSDRLTCARIPPRPSSRPRGRSRRSWWASRPRHRGASAFRPTCSSPPFPR